MRVCVCSAAPFAASVHSLINGDLANRSLNDCIVRASQCVNSVIASY